MKVFLPFKKAFCTVALVGWSLAFAFNCSIGFTSMNSPESHQSSFPLVLHKPHSLQWGSFASSSIEYLIQDSSIDPQSTEASAQHLQQHGGGDHLCDIVLSTASGHDASSNEDLSGSSPCPADAGMVCVVLYERTIWVLYMRLYERGMMKSEIKLNTQWT